MSDTQNTLAKGNQEPRTLNTFLNADIQLDFGDYLLFQEYRHGKQNDYNVSKPILCIYLGYFVADQTLGFNYVKWNNHNHRIYITNEHVTNYRACKEVDKINCHIEWSDFIDILGHWKQKPNWKQIIADYRKQNIDTVVNKTQIQLT